ncbi:hypothetical protein ZIOFF_006077 [Zingiber officinale]|uniref:S1-like domain-containing protein n=1 Tax=Zingiber officinale TaxID=94328 RepID=A0A8J5HRQ0_ZINOF|nr:hypothetical protein ZIOFF_006077 [Zingiber officinale]
MKPEMRSTRWSSSPSLVGQEYAQIADGDIILVGLCDYQDDKADIIFKYIPDEARLLKACGELPENIRLNEGTGGLDEEYKGGADDYIEFEDEDIDKI